MSLSLVFAAQQSGQGPSTIIAALVVLALIMLFFGLIIYVLYSALRALGRFLWTGNGASPATPRRPGESPGRRILEEEPDERYDEVEAGQRRAGKEGERVVRETLLDAARQSYCYAFYRLRERTAGDIDHLVVSAGGVTIVETKANRGTLTWDGQPTSEMFIDGEPFHRDLMKQMQRQIGAFESRFSHTPVSEGKGARPLAEIVGERGKHWMWCFTRADLGQAHLRTDRHISTPETLCFRIATQPVLFTEDEVDYIAGRIARAYGIEADATPDGAPDLMNNKNGHHRSGGSERVPEDGPRPLGKRNHGPGPLG